MSAKRTDNTISYETLKKSVGKLPPIAAPGFVYPSDKDQGLFSFAIRTQHPHRSRVSQIENAVAKSNEDFNHGN